VRARRSGCLALFGSRFWEQFKAVAGELQMTLLPPRSSYKFRNATVSRVDASGYERAGRRDVGA